MSVTIIQPPGVNVGVNNPGDIIYIQGSESVDGSIRLEVIPSNGSTVTEIQKRVSGIWQPTSFKTGAESVLVGLLVSLSAAGNNLITVDGANTTFFNAKSSLVDGVSTSLATMINATDFTVRAVFRSDESSTFTGTLIENVTLASAIHLITGKFYFKTGATAATEPVRIEAWNGTDDTGLKIFDQFYPASEFPADAEIALTLEGFLEFFAGDDTFTRITSDADFSLKGAASNDAWWLAVDFSTINDDDILQTVEWVDGNTFTRGDWTVQNRQVYVCNVTGIQSGTFAGNPDKWDLLVNVSVENLGTTVYVKGDESTDGSIRFEIVLVDSAEVAEIQKRTSGIWQPTSFKTGPESVFVGIRVALGAAGQHLVTQDTDGSFRFHAHNDFDGELSTSDAQIISAFAFEERVILQADNSGEFTGTLIGSAATTPAHALTNTGYLQTGSTAATDTLRIQVFKGTDNTGAVIFDQSYPASQFPANSEVIFDADGYVEFETGETTFIQISSNGTFSFKTDAAGTELWVAADASFVREDDILQTIEWISGNNFEKGQWTIQARQVYVCNVTGIQTGTFNGNLDKWDLLMPVTLHDRQDVTVSGPITTTSTTFVDIPGATLTTKDLGDTGNYEAWASIEAEQTNNNSSITFRIVVDGVPGASRTIQFGPAASGQPQHIPLLGHADGISAGVIVKTQWLVSVGEGQINNMVVIIDGILDSRVI